MPHEHRELLPAQPGDAAPFSVRLQPDVLGAQLGPAGLEEVGKLPVSVHDVEYASPAYSKPHPVEVGLQGARQGGRQRGRAIPAPVLPAAYNQARSSRVLIFRGSRMLPRTIKTEGTHEPTQRNDGRHRERRRTRHRGQPAHRGHPRVRRRDLCIARLHADVLREHHLHRDPQGHGLRFRDRPELGHGRTRLQGHARQQLRRPLVHDPRLRLRRALRLHRVLPRRHPRLRRRRPQGRRVEERRHHRLQDRQPDHPFGQAQSPRRLRQLDRCRERQVRVHAAHHGDRRQGQAARPRRDHRRLQHGDHVHEGQLGSEQGDGLRRVSRVPCG